MKRTTKVTLIAIAGVLTVGGIAVAAKKYQEHGEMRRAFAPGKILEQIDTNSDRAASREELLTFFSGHFAKADKDGDGKIAKADIITAIDASELPDRVKKRSDRMADRVIGSADINEDGTIELAEVENRLGKFHALADWNDDGKVEIAEMKRLRSGMGRGGRKHNRE